MSVERFMKRLQAFSAPQVFNPWKDYDERYDIHKRSSLIRRRQLSAYLEERIGKAKMLIMVFSGVEPTRTSNGSSVFITKQTQREKGFNEPTDSVVWNAMLDANMDPYEVVLWNIFPFHPYKGDDGLTNRTPTKEELDQGWVYTSELMKLFPDAQILGVGQKSSQTLQDYGVKVQATLRHPANGGAGLYKQQFKEFCETL